MAQLSRPYQIALVAALAALALFAAVWFVALRHPAAESAGSSPAPSTPSAARPAGSSSAAAPTRVHHGAAPGVKGLTRDIAKAHRAASAAAATHTAKSAHGSPAGAGSHAAAAKRAASLESQLAHGKTAVVLFWNPKASDDREVDEQLRQLGHSDRQLSVQVARSNEVAAFGKFTQTVQVTGTPTVLIVNSRRQATTVTGLTDSFSLQQAIGDAKEGAGRVLAPHFSSWSPTSSRAKFIQEANRVCRQATGPTLQQLRSLGSLKAIVAAYVNAVATVYHRVEDLHVPPQDRAFIHQQFSAILTVLRREPHPTTRLALRQVFLEGEVAGDRLYNALTAYGLTGCV